MRKTVLLTSITLAVLSCNKADRKPIIQNNTSTLTNHIELPNTPEAVVKAWENAINTNQYTFAQQISYGAELEFVRALEESYKIEQSQNIQSEVLNLKCVQESADIATCRCMIKYEDGSATFKYLLVRNNGQWLISDIVPDETQERINQKPTRTVQK